MLIWININIAATTWDLIHLWVCCGQMKTWGKMLLFLELIIVLHINYKSKKTLVLGEGPAQGLDNASKQKLNIPLILRNH